MSKNDLPYYPFYPDEFVGSGKVGAMCTLAVGAYKLLLCKAWRENPVGTIPNDDRVLRAWSRLTETEWGSVRAEVLAAFTLGDDGRFYQARMRREYEEIRKKSSIRAKAGQAGARSRWQPHGKRIANASHARSESDSLELSKQPTATEPKLRTAQVLRMQSSELYGVYPKHVGKPKALQAIEKALALKPYDALLEATKAFAAAVSRWSPADQQYVPHPATWFNQGRYDDDRATWVRFTPKTNKPSSTRFTDNERDMLTLEQEARREGYGS